MVQCIYHQEPKARRPQKPSVAGMSSSFPFLKTHQLSFEAKSSNESPRFQRFIQNETVSSSSTYINHACCSYVSTGSPKSGSHDLQCSSSPSLSRRSKRADDQHLSHRFREAVKLLLPPAEENPQVSGR